MMLAIVGGEPERFKPFVDLYRSGLERLGKPVQDIGVHWSAMWLTTMRWRERSSGHITNVCGAV